MLGNLQDNDIKLLRMFRVIVECGGFSAAQARLNISQSAISTRMAQLEVRLGCRLCERGMGNFELTEDGAAVLHATEKLFAALEDFRSELADSRGRLTGELRLGLIDNTVTLETALIRDAISAFVSEAPDARLTIHVGTPIELEQRVMDGQLHLGIGLFHHEIPGIHYQPLCEEKHWVYCASSHPFFHREDGDITPAELQAADYVGWGYIEDLRDWEPPYAFNEQASSPNIEAVTYLILSGRYIGYLPTHCAEFWVQRGELRALRIEALNRSSEFKLITKKSTGTTRLTALMMEKLQAGQDG